MFLVLRSADRTYTFWISESAASNASCSPFSSGAAVTEQLSCQKCGFKCRNCNTTVERRRPSPRNQDPWNREPPMAACAICDEVSCSTCRQQARCSNCLNDYCASCSSMKICSECDRQLCTDCTRSEFLFLLCFWCYIQV